MAYDVFISYSSRDKPIADGVCANLEAAGVRCWIAPRDIQAGREWPAEISKAIPQCRAMVLVFSAHSNNSDDVSRELVLAANNKLTIIPFKIDAVTPQPGMDYYLARTHWLDAMNPPTREQIYKLVETVIKLLGLKGLAPAPFIPFLPAGSEKSLETPKKKTIDPRLLRIGIPLVILLAIGLCAVGAYLGTKLLAANKSSLAPTQAQFATPSLPVGMLAQVTNTAEAIQAWTATAPASSPAIATSTTAPFATAAANVSSINISATPGAILEVPGKYVAYSPDGKWLVIGERQIHFYDPKSLKEVRSVPADRWVNGMAISPDSKVLAAIDESRGVMLFDMATGSELRTLPRTILSVGNVSSSFLAFSPDSQTLAVVVGDAIKLFDVATGQDKGTLVAKGSNAIAFATDGKSLYAGGWSGIAAWDVASGSQIRSYGDISSSAVRLALSPDGSLLVTGGSFDEPMVLWEAATGRQLRTFAGHKGGITSLAFSQDGKLLASSAGDVTLKLWDVATGTLLQTLVGHTQAASSLALSPDGTTLVSGSQDGTTRLWTLSAGGSEPTATPASSATISLPTALPLSSNAVSIDNASQVKNLKIIDVQGNSVASSADGKWLVIGGSQIHFYNTRNMTEVHSFQGNLTVEAVAISPDCQVLAAIDITKGVMLFDLASGSSLRTLPRSSFNVTPNNSYLAFSPDSQTLAVVLGKTVKLFKVADGQEIETIVVKDADAILFSPDGKTLYAGGAEGNNAFDVVTGSQIQSYGDMTKGASQIALSPDGSLLVTGGLFDEPMVLWEAATGRQLRTFAGHKNGITGLAFSPDGKLLISSAGDVTIKLWDVATGNLLQTLVGPTEAASSLAISPDGATLASIGYNQGVWLWGVAGK